jgi:mxaL protein
VTGGAGARPAPARSDGLRGWAWPAWLRTAARHFGARKPWLVAAALGLAVALLGPRVPLPGRDWRHLVVIDITQSMNATDMPGPGAPVSRLAFVKHALGEAIATLPCGSQLGLAIFTEYRSLVLLAPVEVCAHFAELRGVVARIDGRMSWAGASEVHKGVGTALRAARALDPAPSLLFVTDGHEAPPLRPDSTPAYEDAKPAVRGLVLGVGGDTLAPIPKFDPGGRALGTWQADEVLQTDPASLGRTPGGNAQSLVGDDGRPLVAHAGSGTEHLSSLKEAHLRRLASAAGLAYRRVHDALALRDALVDPALAVHATRPRELRTGPALLALLALVIAFRPRLAAARR